MSVVLGDCAQGWWPKKVSIPVRAHITDIRVVQFHNYSRIAVYGVMVLGFLFYVDWTAPVHVDYSYNAWADSPSYRDENAWLNGAGEKEIFCNNSDYDYEYDSHWKYNSLKCRRLTSKEAFTKSIAGDTYWLSTLIVEDYMEVCDPNTGVTRSATNESCDTRNLYNLNEEGNYFVEGLEGIDLSITLETRASMYGYNSQNSKDTRPEIIIHLPGWGDDSNEHEVLVAGDDIRLKGMAFGLRMNVSTWLKLFNTSLDEENPNAGVPESVGKAINRIVGLRFTIGVELRNRADLGFLNARWPIGELEMHLYLNAEKRWTRQVLGTLPGRSPYEIAITDAYGIRLKMVAVEEGNLRISDVSSASRSLLDLVVFVIVFKSLIRAFALFGLGSSSHKWRRALNMNVETHVLVNRDSRHKIKQHSRAIEQADNILASLGRKLMRSIGIDPTKIPADYNYAFNRGETRRMFAILDVDGDGVASVDEIEEVLKTYGIAYTELELSTIMHILDRNGSGNFEEKEFSKTISRALLKNSIRKFRRGEKKNGNDTYEDALNNLMENDEAVYRVEVDRHHGLTKNKHGSIFRQGSKLWSSYSPKVSRPKQKSMSISRNKKHDGTSTKRNTLGRKSQIKSKRSIFEIEDSTVGNSMSI